MDQKEANSQHVEASEAQNVTDASAPLQQRTTRFMVFFSLYIGLAGWIYNFDLGYGGIVLIMQPYNKDFGVCVSKPNAAGVMTQVCALTALQQSMISLTFLFVALGGAIGGVTGNYLGRRGTIQVGCVFVAIGAGGMLGTTGNFTAYVVCKCIGGIGLGHFIASAPAYGVECTAASSRGMLTSLFNIGLGFGNAVAAAVCAATSTYTSSLAWQIPIICQLPLALILGVGVMIFPESPRWLLVKGKEEAARKSFAKFNNSEPWSPETTRQVQEVQFYIELEKEAGSTTKWTEIFTNPTDRRRTMTSLLVVMGQALSGGKFISTYASLFLAGVGISNTYVIIVLVSCCALLGGLFAPWIVEYGGRRFSLLTGYAIMAVFMLIIAAVASGLGSQGVVSKNVLVVFLSLWTFIYGGFIGPSISTTAPEMHSVRLRTYGQACVVSVYEVFSFAAAFYTPYMLSAQYGNMGTNVGYFYFGLTVIIWVMIFLWVPETARLTLEQIDDYFLSGRKAWKTSTRRNNKIAKGEAVDHTGEREFKKTVDNWKRVENH